MVFHLHRKRLLFSPGPANARGVAILARTL